MKHMYSKLVHKALRVQFKTSAAQLSFALIGFGFGISLLVPPLNAQEPPNAVGDSRPLASIKELMEKTITPATNTLWNVFELPTDEEWLALEEAAVTLLVAANVVMLGGTGPMDGQWVREPAWKAFNEVMISAGYDALEATRARDLEALTKAGEVLYAPCEGCHLQFNPGVVNAQQE